MTLIAHRESDPSGEWSLPPLATDQRQSAMQRAMARSLAPSCAGLGLLFVMVALAHWLVVEPPDRAPLTIMAVVTSAAFFSLWRVFTHLRIRDRWAHPVGFGLGLLVFANSFSHLALTADLSQTVTMLLLMVGASALLISPIWLAALIGVVFVTWITIATRIAGSEEIASWSLAFLYSVALALLLHYVRLRALMHLTRLRDRDREHHARLSEALQRAESNEERYQLAMRGSNDGIWDWDLRTDRISVSPRWKAILGVTSDGTIGKPALWLDRIHPSDRDRVGEDLRRHLDGHSPHFECSHRLRHEDGDYRWALVRGLAVRDESDRATRIAGSLTDVTGSGTHDQLTGLPNRSLLLNRISVCLEQRRRSPDRLFAVLHLDLNRFQRINESLGHRAGDRLLMAVADRLDAGLRASDLVTQRGATLSREGGDEFTVLLEHVASEDEALKIAKRILQSLRQPFEVHDNEVFTSARIGIALVDAGVRRPDDMIRRASMAAHRTRAFGDSPITIFEPGMETQAQSALQIESELRRALDRDELCVHYQAIFDLRNSSIVGFEALVRWQHPEQGLLPPNTFIPVAERSELIVEVDSWVLRQACQDVRAWHELDPSLSLHVNLSARHFSRPELVERVARTLEETRFPPSNLVLEITESLLVEKTDLAVEMLGELRRLGVRVALDDFGTGYSSLSQLHQFAIDLLKIDRSFLAEGSPGVESSQLVRTIVSLGRYLGVDVVAEGVESDRQSDQLRALGCQMAQGFRFSRPIAHDQAQALLVDQLPPPGGDSGSYPQHAAAGS